MEKFEQFSRSNILAIMLQNHNEGGSRDPERLVRMAYQEYMDSPHLRHIESYYLNDIRFYPPNLSSQEQILYDQHQLTPCFVDLGNNDNWCLKTERYMLQKLQRDDPREEWIVANRQKYLNNRELMIINYAKVKLQQLRQEDQIRAEEEAEMRREHELSRARKQREEVKRREKEESNAGEFPAGSSAKAGNRITDFFPKKQAQSSRVKKMQGKISFLKRHKKHI